MPLVSIRFNREQTAAILFALARLALCCYRASTQSIVHDEAFTYLRFVAGPWSSVYSTHDANNHVLYSMLAKVSVGALGLSEFALRLPSLLAGFFLILGLFWLLQFIPSRPTRWITVVALSVHPLMLDFSVAARGYGLSLALFTWALYCCFKKRYISGGVLLGCAVSANLTIAFPALALFVAMVALEDGDAKARLRVLISLAMPCTAVFALICYAPLRTAHRAHFYVGASTLYNSIFNLIYRSVRTKVAPAGILGTEQTARIIEILILPLIGASILWASRFAFARDRRSLIPLVTLGTAIIGLISAHILFEVKYPEDRMGLWLILLFAIAWAFALGNYPNLRLRAVHGLLACLLIIQFATQFETHAFYVWSFDKYTKEIAQRLKIACAGRPDHSLSVSATEAHQPALEFYRQNLGIDALKPVKFQQPAPLSGYDFYVLNYPDAFNPEMQRLHILFHDHIAGVVFATNP